MALTLTPELAATIRGARLVGTPLRACAKAAGVPWDPMIGWLRVGRAYNAAEPAKRNPRHVAQAAFAAELDRAGAQCESALHARVMKATEDDGRLALDVLRWNEERATRKLKRDLVAAQVEVERARAASLSINLRDTARGHNCCMPSSKRVAGHYSSVKPFRAPRASGWWLWWLVVAAP